MDKYEYKVRADEIKELISEGEYTQAAELADTIDWRRVKSVMMLCTVSDLYKINRRYEDAKNLLLLAYEKRPGGKTICYSLCELYIKSGDLVKAVNFFNEYSQVAPKDSGRYILQYKIYEAQDVRLEERISVLEELKKRDYREKWAYELAYLYHRIGLATKCVEECDELILWFGEGKYVIKAMELKMLHQPLTAVQQEKYEHRFDNLRTNENTEPAAEPFEEHVGGYEEPEEAAAETSQVSLKEEPDPEGGSEQQVKRPEEMDIQVKPMDVGQYNTINLQAELAAGLKEVLDEEKTQSDVITRSILAPLLNADTKRYEPLEAVEKDGIEPDNSSEVIEESEVFFGETGDMSGVAEGTAADGAGQVEEEVIRRDEEEFFEGAVDEKETGEKEAEGTAEIIMRQLQEENQSRGAEQVMTAQPPEKLARVLSQEPDGQLSLVVPERETVEKQITGQMNIGDVLNEWERIKKENAEKRMEEVRQHVKEQTGTMFTEFEESVRDGLLEKLESGRTAGLQGLQEGEDVPEEGYDEQSEDDFTEYPEKEDQEEEYLALQEEDGDLMQGEEIAAETDDQVPEDSDEDIAEDGIETEGEAPEDYGEVEELEEIEEPGADAWEFEDQEAEDSGEGDREFEDREGEDSGEDGQEFEDQEAEDSGEVDREFEDQEAEDSGEVDREFEDREAEVSGEDGQEFEDREAEDSGEVDREFEDQEAEASGGDEQEFEDREAEASGGDEQEFEDRRGSTRAGRYRGNGASNGSVDREKAKTRELTREEKELFAPFIQSRAGCEKLVRAIDNISMAAFTGNIIITGEEGMDKLALAKNMIREVQMTDSNFSGRVARVSGKGMNSKNMTELLEKLKSGALIIETASDMEAKTVAALHRGLQQERLGIIVILTDTKRAMVNMLTAYPQLKECFTARMDMEAMSNEALVTYGKQYAREMEYSIDDLGVLALHTRIEEQQTIDHAVTAEEVRRIVDDAIGHANRKTPGHFFDILFAKRYDEEDMIILTEKDFV